MLELRQGNRRFTLKERTKSTVTLASEATVKLGEAYLVRGDARGTHRLIVTVTGQDGLVVHYGRVKVGRPRADLDIDKLRALQAGGMTLDEIGERFGVTRRTIERRLGPVRKKKDKKSK